jgi:hypothetical protein
MRSFLTTMTSFLLAGLIGCVAIGDDEVEDPDLDMVEQSVTTPLCPAGQTLYCQCSNGGPWVPAQDQSSCGSTCPGGNYIGDCRGRRDPFPGGPGGSSTAQ